MLPTLLNDLADQLTWDARGRPSLLVLDDYHLIEQPAIHEMMAGFVARLPPQLQLVIASREDPPAPLLRLHMRQLQAALRTSDLAFSVAEAGRFLRRSMQTPLEDETVALLVTKTEGWVAALQLAAVSLHDHSHPRAFVARFGGTHRQLFRYLVEEVLSRQPDYIQLFLLRTSVLDRLCADLCAALLHAVPPSRRGGETVQPGRLLAHLEQAHLFVTALDDEGRWYRYHHLFAEALQQRLREVEPDLEPLLRRQASRWFEQAGYLTEAVDQALAMRDWDRATGLIEQIHLFPGGYGTNTPLETWLDALPPSVVRARPLLRLGQALVARDRFQLHELKSLLDEIERDVAGQEGTATRVSSGQAPAPAGAARPQQTSHPATIASVQARIQVLRAPLVWMLEGDLPGARASLQLALDQLPADDLDWHAAAYGALAYFLFLMDELDAASDAFERSQHLAREAGNHDRLFTALHGRANLLSSAGSLHAAQAALDGAHRLAVSLGVQHLPVVAGHNLVAADIAYQRNDLAGAELAFNRLHELPEHYLTEFWQSMSYLALCRLRWAQGEMAAAFEALERAAAILRPAGVDEPGGGSRAWRWVSGLRARLLLSSDGLAAVASWLDEAAAVDPASAALGNWHDRTFLLMQPRILLLAGQADAALALLVPLYARAERIRAHAAQVEILVLEALAHQQLGRCTAALEVLMQGLTLAAPEGLARAFLDEGAALVPLLEAVLHRLPLRSVLRGHVRYLLDALAGGDAAAQPRDAGGFREESVTQRELEVLPPALCAPERAHAAESALRLWAR